IVNELSKVVIGQRQVIEELLVAMFARGHCLLVGVPGLAKTLMIRTVADALALQFSRIQFTPDLMPADITGTEVIQDNRATGQREFRFVNGPIFGNVILADEINRTPPKTQAALLEAMQEHQVTIGGQRHPLPEPFFVLATQNPIEQEGTYPLPEAQLDRFMFHVWVDYPTAEDRKSTRLNSSHQINSYAGFCLKKKKAQSDTIELAYGSSRCNRVENTGAQARSQPPFPKPKSAADQHPIRPSGPEHECICHHS